MTTLFVLIICCILSKFYIKPQQRRHQQDCRSVVSYRNSTSNHNVWANADTYLALYLIEILHQTTTARSSYAWALLLYLIEILHQTTTTALIRQPRMRCILSKFYIKPQLSPGGLCFQSVVSYRNSTSNHNRGFAIRLDTLVVSYRNSTSNHNILILRSVSIMLYLIEILHQTTTSGDSFLFCYMLYLIEILHQTTTPLLLRQRRRRLYLIEILHQTTTLAAAQNADAQLYLIEILHQTTTAGPPCAWTLLLYLIEILHQTTTIILATIRTPWLYLIEILHQTTTASPP